jgi:hypothetical protein
MKKDSTPYHVERFLRIREGALDLLRTAHGKHMIHALIEIDSTQPRQ